MGVPFSFAHQLAWGRQAMSTDDVQIDRKSLYELVWSQPISKLAETYGYSDVGFAKLCHKLGIPLTSRGHWAKLKAGRAVTQLPYLRQSITSRSTFASCRCPSQSAWYWRPNANARQRFAGRSLL